MPSQKYKDRVLVVDDTPENIDALTGILESDYQVKVALNGKKALDIAQSKDPPDLILLDIMMPEMDGYEVCRRLKSESATHSIPVIFITALDTEMDEAKALSLGAVDFITKPFNPYIAKARVKTHIKIQSLIRKNEQMIDELRETNQLLDRLARRDQLTDLSNRRDMNEKFEIEMKRSQRNGKPFCCVLCDIDHFKQINDVYGHAAGDRVLIQVANIIRSDLRRHDVGARWGGEEFLIMLPETGLAGAQLVAERLRQKTEAEKFHFEKQTVPITMSFGVAEYDGSENLEAVLKRADQNLYVAKNNGRNKVVSM